MCFPVEKSTVIVRIKKDFQGHSQRSVKQDKTFFNSVFLFCWEGIQIKSVKERVKLTLYSNASKH